MTPEQLERRRKRLRERNRERRANDPAFREREREQKRERWANDPAFRERQRERWANDPAYRAACKAAGARRRARQRAAIPANETRAEQKAVREFYQGCPEGHHVDHRVPLACGGEHAIWNLQYLPGPENLAKGATVTEADIEETRRQRLLWRPER